MCVRAGVYETARCVWESESERVRCTVRPYSKGLIWHGAALCCVGESDGDYTTANVTGPRVAWRAPEGPEGR